MFFKVVDSFSKYIDILKHTFTDSYTNYILLRGRQAVEAVDYYCSFIYSSSRAGDKSL